MGILFYISSACEVDIYLGLVGTSRNQLSALIIAHHPALPQYDFALQHYLFKYNKCDVTCVNCEMSLNPGMTSFSSDLQLVSSAELEQLMVNDGISPVYRLLPNSVRNLRSTTLE